MTEQSFNRAQQQPGDPACPICGGWRLSSLLADQSFPLAPLCLHSSAEAARTHPRFAAPQNFCSGCGHICCGAPAEAPPGGDRPVPFAPPPADDLLATRLEALVRRYHLAGLRAGLVGAEDDPALSACAQALRAAGVDDIQWFDPKATAQEAGNAAPDLRHCDLIVCLDALAMASGPARLLHRLKTAADRPHDTVFYFELPDATWQLRLGTAWTLPLVGPNAFSAGSLRRLLRRSGFEILQQTEIAAGRRLAAAARAASEPGDANTSRQDAERFMELIRQADDQTARLARAAARWRNELLTAAERGRELAFYGAAPPVILLLDMLQQQAPEAVAQAVRVVDADPTRQGRYLPGSAIQIAPAASVDPARLALAVLTDPPADAETTLASWRRAQPGLRSLRLA